MQIKALRVAGKARLVEKIFWNIARLISAITEHKTNEWMYLVQCILLNKYSFLNKDK